MLLKLCVGAAQHRAERAAQRFATLGLTTDVLLQFLSAQHSRAVRTVCRCAWTTGKQKFVIGCWLTGIKQQGPGVTLTLVLSSLVFGQSGCVREELEADVTLDQSLELPGVACEHLWVVGSVMVPQT